MLRPFGGSNLSVKKECTTIACAEHEGMWNVLLVFLFSANPSSPTKKYDTFGPSVPERLSHWVNPAYLSELMSIA